MTDHSFTQWDLLVYIYLKSTFFAKGEAFLTVSNVAHFMLKGKEPNCSQATGIRKGIKTLQELLPIDIEKVKPSIWKFDLDKYLEISIPKTSISVETSYIRRILDSEGGCERLHMLIFYVRLLSTFNYTYNEILGVEGFNHGVVGDFSMTSLETMFGLSRSALVKYTKSLIDLGVLVRSVGAHHNIRGEVISEPTLYARPEDAVYIDKYRSLPELSGMFTKNFQ